MTVPSLRSLTPSAFVDAWRLHSPLDLVQLRHGALGGPTAVLLSRLAEAPSPNSSIIEWSVVEVYMVMSGRATETRCNQRLVASRCSYVLRWLFTHATEVH